MANLVIQGHCEGHGCLAMLNLSNNHLKSIDARFVGAILLRVTTLQILKLNFNNLRDVCFKCFLFFLFHC